MNGAPTNASLAAQVLAIGRQWATLTPELQAQRTPTLKANPIIVQPPIWAEIERARAEQPGVVARLDDLREAELLVVAEDLAAARLERTSLPGYMNRAARRAAKRTKGGRPSW